MFVKLHYLESNNMKKIPEMSFNLVQLLTHFMFEVLRTET